MNRRLGFSLIEMIAVLGVIGIIVAAVSISWGPQLNRVNYRSSIERVIEINASIRRHALRTGSPANVKIDLDKDLVVAERLIGGRYRSRVFRLPETVDLVSVVTDGGERSNGQQTIDVSKLGVTQTWAIKLAQENRQTWVVFAGRSGQALEYEDDDDVKEIFKKIEAAGANSR